MKNVAFVVVVVFSICLNGMEGFDIVPELKPEPKSRRNKGDLMKVKCEAHIKLFY